MSGGMSLQEWFAVYAVMNLWRAGQFARVMRMVRRPGSQIAVHFWR